MTQNIVIIGAGQAGARCLPARVEADGLVLARPQETRSNSRPLPDVFFCRIVTLVFALLES